MSSFMQVLYEVTDCEVCFDLVYYVSFCVHTYNHFVVEESSLPYLGWQKYGH